MSKFKIAWLFPDTLYLHGERGNILAFERFAALAGFQVETDQIQFDCKNFDPMEYQIIFCPPGEIASFPMVKEILMAYKEKLEAFVKAGRPLIATGTSVALWCKKIQREDGSCFDGLGILDAVAVEKETVYGDDNYFSCNYNQKEIEIIGNQIQMADFKSETEKPFGTLIYGYGNTGTDRQEGFVKNNSIFTNALGPVFVTNPMLTIEVIKAAAKCSDLEYKDVAFDDSLEQKSFATKKQFILSKESRLTNCK